MKIKKIECAEKMKGTENWKVSKLRVEESGYVILNDILKLTTKHPGFTTEYIMSNQQLQFFT